MNAPRILHEDLFRHMLLLERKRSERTAAPFLLVLLDFELMMRGTTRLDLQQAALSLAETFRDTDVVGWHKNNSTMGIIFTALNGTGRSQITEAISSRLQQALATSLTASELKRIASFHFFPEADENTPDFSRPDRVMYPEAEDTALARRSYGTVKRMMDVAASVTALVVLSPLFLLIAAAIKATSTGPVLFRQTRLGKHGKEFTFLKFRSMYVANDPQVHKHYTQQLIRGNAASTGVYKLQNDPRITPFGRFLRVSSLDELPQFINVLCGHMSLVGPRPPIPYEFECYHLWHRRRVLEIKPGITGLWQVNGRSRTTFDEMVRMDLQYVREQSFWLDLKILVKTPVAMVSGDGAY
jgi:lipopolysaccharide/colanic/teichoic acid biosynthesis glycosyltransferase